MSIGVESERKERAIAMRGEKERQKWEVSAYEWRATTGSQGPGRVGGMRIEKVLGEKGEDAGKKD